jgi:hypothetical protein
MNAVAPLTFLVLMLASQLPERSPSADWRAEVEAWKSQRLGELTAERGWLAVSGLVWLKPGVNVAGATKDSAVLLPDGPPRAGVFDRSGDVVTWRPEGAAPRVLDLKDEPWRLGRVSIQLIRRQSLLGLRIWDPESERRRGFSGLSYFDLDPSYRVQGRLRRHDKPTALRIANVIGQTNEMESPGVVQFEMRGRAYSLTPVFETAAKEDLFYIFRDETAGETTYAAGRFLHGPLPNPDGSVELDFNRAYSPPCAFTDFATCPLPPAVNRLRTKIEAGEKSPH